MRDSAYGHLERYLFYRARPLPLKESDFTQMLERAKEAVRGLSQRFLSQVEGLFKLRQELRLSGSVFAQELGTAHSISPKRLDKKLEQIGQAR